MAVKNVPLEKSSVLTLNPYNTRTSPHYSYIAQASGPSNVINFAGQIGIAPNGQISADPVEQVQEALNNLRRCLEAAGAGVSDIMHCKYYVVDYDHTDPFYRRPLQDFYGEHRPAATLIPVHKLAVPGIMFEIEVIATIPQRPIETVDVVVVGAGLSGLRAAVSLQNAGLSVKVVEARDRIGGKTWSRPAQGSVCDVGAAWINDTNQSKMFALAERYGLETVKQNVSGNIIVDDGVGKLKTHPYGQLLSNDEDKTAIEDVIRVRDAFEEACQQIHLRDVVASGTKVDKDLDNMTFEDWIKSHNCCEDAVNALKIGTRAMLGVEPNEMSALYFMDYCKSGGGYMQMRSDKRDGGQYLRIAQGTQSFSRGLANELKPGTVLLMSPVRRIEQHADKVVVTSARGTFLARRVIVSVPTPLYKEIAFHPSLPAEKAALAGATRLGDYSKAIAFYKKPWWREHDLCGLSQSVHGPFAVTRDSSVDTDGHYSLTCFITGQPARDWAKLPAAERRKFTLDQIQTLFGPFAIVEEPIEIQEQIWHNEQWSQGCPCPVMGPGGLTRFEHVLRATADKIHFVGTETAYEWKGYMEGAVRSGERGAEEVVAALKSSK